MKNIVISGANRGIGYYMVQELLKKGYNVTVLDIEIDNLTSIDGNILPIICDISDRESVKESVKKALLTSALLTVPFRMPVSAHSTLWK